MQSEEKIFDTLLKGLKNEDYDSLIRQEQLRLDGFKLHFIVDADLINHYCYPYGITEKEKKTERENKLTSDYIVDEQVTLHSLFKLNYGDQRLIFLDEYLYEFQGMIYKATKHGKNLTNKITLPSITFPSEQSDLKELLFSSFSKIFSTVVLNINGLKKATNLFKERSLIFESGQFEDEFLIECANNNLGNQLKSLVISNLMMDVLKLKLYESSKRDSVIIERIISMNNYVQYNSKNKEQKHIFIFLSDSTWAKKLFEFMRSRISPVEYPKINNRRINLFRSTQQMFAYLISLSYDTNKELNHTETINNLRKLKVANQIVEEQIKNTEELLKQNDPQKANVDLLFSDEYKNIFDNYRSLRNAFENTGLLKNYDNLYNSIKDEIKLLNFDGLEAFFEKLNDEMKVLTKELNSEHGKYLEKLQDEATFTTTFIDSISLINSSDGLFDVSKGVDFVEGSYQHLPIFLIFPFESSDYQIHMNKLLMMVLKRKADESKQLYIELESLIDLMKKSKHNFEEQMEVNLLKSFIFMILPSKTIEKNNELKIIGRRNDTIAYKWLQLLSKNSNVDKYVDSDLKYLLCWVTRRIGDYPQSLSYAENGIKEYKDDPRFYHGKYLALYCIYESETAKHKNSDKINEILHGVQMARNCYIPFIKTMFWATDTNLILSKLEDTFNNSYCYFLTLKAYEYHKNRNSIGEIRSFLQEAREKLECIKENGVFHDELPEYFDTEAHLEYLESFYWENKLDKIKYAKMAIERAIYLSNHVELREKYKVKYKEINSRILELER